MNKLDKNITLVKILNGDTVLATVYQTHADFDYYEVCYMAEGKWFKARNSTVDTLLGQTVSELLFEYSDLTIQKTKEY